MYSMYVNYFLFFLMKDGIYCFFFRDFLVIYNFFEVGMIVDNFVVILFGFLVEFKKVLLIE